MLTDCHCTCFTRLRVWIQAGNLSEGSTHASASLLWFTCSVGGGCSSFLPFFTGMGPRVATASANPQARKTQKSRKLENNWQKKKDKLEKNWQKIGRNWQKIGKQEELVGRKIGSSSLYFGQFFSYFLDLGFLRSVAGQCGRKPRTTNREGVIPGVCVWGGAGIYPRGNLPCS